MLPATCVAVILLSFLSVISVIIGIWLAFTFRKSTRGVAAGIGFSAGIMLWISFLELLPEAAASNLALSMVSLVLGFMLLFSLHYLIPHTHLIKERGKLGLMVKAAFLVSIGLVLHDFPEGFAMASSYIHAPALGIFVAIAIAIHNVPEEFAMALPLVIVKKRGFLIKIALLSALAEPMGAVIGLLAVGAAPALNPAFMAFAAGAMIFVSLHELFPMAKQYRKTWWFVAGMVASLAVYFGLGLVF